ncbi:hypothetical protein [Mesorhizobium sp.]|uniref:hypothetical protein n=1 Tax=Mesorhizobium sp. TaxID=1871066 RepID=UPI00122965EB|nr:hypothetical protein [Mesorhizobium sp.]TIO04491.1 MAG: hypothetical protein E5X88_31560 [Mesorhizobium sp.]TIO29302.1 MAG: hypothetical protein E5X89_31500 [Mesorhizobium sp.]TIP09896.1 MAG: hypothetical protein E5X73_24405 [Mesorhizobium sp.]
MNEALHANEALFENGPPVGVQRRLGIVKGSQLNVGRRAMIVGAVGWAPLLVLAGIQNVTMHTDGITSLLWDAGVHARYLIAAPLLVLAEAQCALRLNAIVRHFADAGLVTDKDRGPYDAAVASTRAQLNSRAAEIIVVVLAYLLTSAAVFSLPFDQIPIWHKTGGSAPAFSPAGWWHVLVSLPLLLTLLLGWAWRFALWAHLLWRIARLDLRLMASHPDGAAGLSVLGYSLRAFSLIAMAIATIIAGRSANIVLVDGALPRDHTIFSAGLLVAVVALFAAPLFFFTPILMKALQRGSFEYGALANRVGAVFEEKWLGRNGPVDNSAIEKPDFSATTDLYAIVANVYALRLVPIDLKSIVMLGIALLLPFVPIVFLALPMAEILAGLKKLLF